MVGVNMNILKNIEKIPAGIFVIPMLCGAVIKTFFPTVLDAGGFITAIFKDQLTTVTGIALICIGGAINLKDLQAEIVRGIAGILLRIVLAYIFAVLLFRMTHSTLILGISSLAFASVFSMPNTTIYVALIEKYEKKAMGLTPFYFLMISPLVTMIVFGGSQMSFHIVDFLAILFPLAFGIILTAWDPHFKPFFEKAISPILFILALCLGTSVDLKDIWYAGFSGVVLSLIVTFSLTITGFFLDRLLKGSGFTGPATSSVAGNAIIIPPIIAQMNPSFEPYVSAAIMQIVSVFFISSILAPLLTMLLSRFFKTRLHHIEK